MSRRYRNPYRFLRAVIIFCTIVIAIDVYRHAAIFAAIGGLLLGYLIGRIHANTISTRPAKHLRSKVDTNAQYGKQRTTLVGYPEPNEQVDDIGD